jgi:hypothetical protein
MTTPTRSEIVARAKELWHMQEARNGNPAFDIEPELCELREEGLLAEAQSELMYSDATKYELEQWEAYNEQTENLDGFTFDVKEAMQTTTFISGSRGTGKSDTAMYAVDQLKNESIICVVFDSSLDWFKRSSISRYVTVQPYSVLEVPNESTIFDISLLTPIEQQKTVETFCKKLFESQLTSDKRFYVVFEESQLYFPLNSIRAKRYQNSARVLTVGRNVNVSMCAISQFPALVDKELIKNAQQIYIGCTAEPNTLTYWRGILGRKTSKLKKLSNGEFLYYHRNKIDKIEIQSYENSTVKKEIKTPQPKPLPKIATQPKTDSTALLKFIVISAIGIAILLLGVR